MTTNLINPLLWQSVPFEDRDAWFDFLHHHEVWHRELAKKEQTSMQPLDDMRDNLLPHANMHRELSDALNIPPATDLVAYDLSDETSFVGWMASHAIDHDRLRQAAGL